MLLVFLFPFSFLRWLIDDFFLQILYNALTHTFQSQRLLRHLVRVLVARASYVEAGKVLHLYVELFDKARETDAAQVARDLRRFHKERQHTTVNGNGGEKMDEKHRGEDVHGVAGDEEDFDIDSDRVFIDTLLFGTRLLCKYLDDPTEGMRMAKRARTIFDEQRDATFAKDTALEGRVERALGIALGAFTAKGTLHPS